MRRAFTMFMAALLWSATAFAQGGGAGTAGAPGGQAGRGGGRGPQGPQVVSPQVNADRTVTVRVLAPKATEVTVTGEILNGSQPKPMTKGDDGIWTATLGPLPPDVYTYAFNIDGVNTPDPRNPWVKLVSQHRPRRRRSKCLATARSTTTRSRCRMGSLQIVTYESKATGATRQAYVYTPPDYNRTSTKYPMLYLLHGGGDLDPGWSMTGRAHIIMDNLIAEKKARADGRRDAARARRRQPRTRTGRHVAGNCGGRQRHARSGRGAAPARRCQERHRRRRQGPRRSRRSRRTSSAICCRRSRRRSASRRGPTIAPSAGCRPAARRRSTRRSAGRICSATSSS